MNFEELNLAPAIVTAVREHGYEIPTAIQTQAIPLILAGHDLLGGAQTGTGKTAAFVLPLLHKLDAGQATQNKFGGTGIRALILTPTRELAAQVEESVKTYGKHLKLTSAVVFGGVGMNPQISRVKKGVDILVATPGRLLDLMQQGVLDLGQVQILVLDEADRMLDMGFIHDVRKVLAALPDVKQSLLFSATMPPDIEALAMSFLRSPQRVAVAPVSSTAERISQSVYKVAKNDKPKLLAHLLKDANLSRVLVFTRTKHGANKVVKQLAESGYVGEAIHGNKSQNAREAALAHFKSGETRILVATDIAARGIDVDNVSHVINYDLPNEPESYVHRIGRTARAGAEGIAIAFCDWDEQGFLNSIEKLTRQKVPVVPDHPFAKSNRGGEPAAVPSDRPPRREPREQSGPRPPSSHGARPQPQRPQGERSGGGPGGPRPPRPDNGSRPHGGSKPQPSHARKPDDRGAGPRPHGRPQSGDKGGSRGQNRSGGGGDRSRGQSSSDRERIERQLDWMKRYT